jgi:hypothetical protein
MKQPHKPQRSRFLCSQVLHILNRRSLSLNDAFWFVTTSLAARERLRRVSFVIGTPATFGTLLSLSRIETLI